MPLELALQLVLLGGKQAISAISTAGLNKLQRKRLFLRMQCQDSSEDIGIMRRVWMMLISFAV